MQKYNWTRIKIALVNKTTTIFYRKNQFKFEEAGIALEDFQQDILYKLVSVSGYKTNSMRFYTDNEAALRGFTFFICKNYLFTLKDKHDKRVEANFFVGYLEDSFNEDHSFYGYEDCLEGKSETTYDFNRLVEIAPDVPVNRFTDLTFKQLLLDLVDKTTTQISTERNIKLSIINKCRKELERFLRGAYV